MTTSPDFDIIDCHAHIFPPLAEAAGCGSPEMHLLYQQRAMHVHGNQPYRRTRDHAVSQLRPLWEDGFPGGVVARKLPRVLSGMRERLGITGSRRRKR